MKIFIVGKQCSGKFEIANILEELGLRVGHEFTNFPGADKNLYIDPKHELLTQHDITTMFECGGYLFITGLDQFGIESSFVYHRGISFHTLDNSDVIILSPTQACNLNRRIVQSLDILWVWVDDTYDHRIRRYRDEERSYKFQDVEMIENGSTIGMVQEICKPGNKTIYFSNEVPDRVAATVYALHEHPDLLPLFLKAFN